MMSFLLIAAETPGVYYAYQHSDAVGKAIVDYMLYGERGKDGVSGSKDDVSDPLQTWGGLLRTAAGAR